MLPVIHIALSETSQNTASQPILHRTVPVHALHSAKDRRLTYSNTLSVWYKIVFEYLVSLSGDEFVTQHASR
jgi:hypothetical protein